MSRANSVSDVDEVTDVEGFVTDRDAALRLVVTSDGQLDPSLLIRTEGWIHKKGGSVNEGGGFSGRRNWKKRWFVLVPVPFLGNTGYELQYFDRPNGIKKGTVSLNETEIFCEERSRHRKTRYEFQIQLQNGNKFFLGCDNNTEREEWIQTLNMVIAFLRKLSTSEQMGIDGYDPAFEDNEDIYSLGDVVAENCRAYGAGLYGAEAGHVGRFSVHVHDINSNSMSRGGTPVTASISNSDYLYYLKIKDHEDGTYSAHYVMSKPGVYQLNIRLNDEHEIFGSPFELNIMPSKTIPDRCIATGDALKAVYPNVVSSFEIIARDIFSNNKTRGGEPFEVGIMGPATMKSLRDNGNGTYTCFFEAQNLAELNYVSGASVMLMVSLFGKPIQGSPFCPNILDPPSLAPKINPTPAATPASVSDRTPIKSSSSSVNSKATENVSQTKPRISEGKMSQDELITGLIPEKKMPVDTDKTIFANNSRLDATSSAGLSKLERARQRALMAKSLSDSANNDAKLGLAYGTLMPPPPPPPPLPYEPPTSGSPDLAMRLNKLEALNNVNHGVAAANAGSSRLHSLGARLEAAKLSAQSAPKPSTTTINNSTGNKPSFDPISVAANIRMGLIGPQPPSLIPEEVAMWGTVHRALCLPEVANQLVPHLGVLKECFDWVSEDLDGYKVVRLTSSNGGGAAKLLESYDIIPAYLSKKEAKMAFFVILSSQKNAGNVPGQAGIVGLEFSSFVKLLLLICIHSLSKASTFSSMYSTIESKIDVMLRQWGFADPLKLQFVKSKSN